MEIIDENLKITKSKKEAILQARECPISMQVLNERWQVNECRVQSFMSIKRKAKAVLRCSLSKMTDC